MEIREMTPHSLVVSWPGQPDLHIDNCQDADVW
ncbi:MAG: hypothetical protein ACI8S6_003669 [Myxococcota bacterium]